MKVFLTACVGLDHDVVLLDAFCKHYLNLGIDRRNFLLVLNTSDYGNMSSRISHGLSILNKHGIEPMDVWCTRYESEEKWNRVHNLLRKFVSPQDWVVHPDTDEFHEIPTTTYEELFIILEQKKVNAIQGILVDRLSKDCAVPKDPSFDGEDIFQQFPKAANLSSLLQIAGVKLVAYKGNMRANNGSGKIHSHFDGVVQYAHGSQQSLHKTPAAIQLLGDPDPTRRPTVLEDWDSKLDLIRREFTYLVHHFKWHGNVIQKLEQRVETYTRLKRAQLHQSIRAMEHYKQNGRFVLE